MWRIPSETLFKKWLHGNNLNMVDKLKKEIFPILVVGNGTYANRGCEAIVRGTTEILGKAVAPGTELAIAAGVYGSASELAVHTKKELDPRVTNFRLINYPPKWSPLWWQEKANRHLGLKLPARHHRLLPYLQDVSVALEVGGDNYTMDYGFPQHLLDMDDWLMARGIPVVIWGASIGPFGETPELETRMMLHLARLKAVFVRESVTYDYLTRGHGLTNVSLFADPAFCMSPVEPASRTIRSLVEDAPLCINISPLLYSYKTTTRKEPWKVVAGDLNDWVAESASIVSTVAREFKQPVLLLPHVGSDLPGIDDYTFLQRVAATCLDGGTRGIRVPDQPVNAAESKWLIARCRLVMAARTHATIAGFSMAVPTVSIGYSQKARGINQDIFGSQEYCIPTKEFNAGSAVASINAALTKESAIRAHLAAASVRLRASAQAAGTHLRELLTNP
jgi:colanic acid/amylovoran biosynthesis protein